MPRKVFTAGEVLAATDVNNFLMDQTVMVFAGTAARGSAIGTAVEGMYTHLNDSDTLQYWDGSAWVDAIPEPPAPAASALTLIKTQTIGSAVTSVEVTGAFSTDYENYLIMVNGGVGSADNRFNLQLGSTTTGYFSVRDILVYANATRFTNANNNGANFPECGAYSSNNIAMQLRLQNPFQSKVTMFQTTTLQTTSGGAMFTNGGMLNNTTSYTAFTLICPSGNVTGGTISVYGYEGIMTKPNIQIDDLVREMTDEEYEAYLVQQAENQSQEGWLEAKIAARASALAKLAELGLTEEEIAAL